MKLLNCKIKKWLLGMKRFKKVPITYELAIVAIPYVSYEKKNRRRNNNKTEYKIVYSFSA